MFLKILNFTLFICFFLFLLSCNTIETNEDIMPIEGKIYFKLWESYAEHDSQQPPKIELVLNTVKEYPHTGHSIIADLSIQGNSINISINGIRNTNAGGDTFAPAGWRKFLDIPSGKYKLTFTEFPLSPNHNNSYTINIDENFIIIEGIEQNFTIPEYNKYCRYPKNSFVYLFGSLVDDSNLCSSFIDSLEKIINIEPFTFPDNCVLPYPAASSGHYYDAPAQFFIYKDEKDFETAGEFLENYSIEIISKHQGLGISLTSWNNESYKSWLYY